MNALRAFWLRLSPGDRRAIRIGGMLLAPAIVLKLLLLPLWHAHVDLRDRLASERGLLAREEGLLAQAQLWPLRATGSEQRLLAAAPHLYDGADPVAGAGALASYLAQRAAARRLFLQQTELAPSATAGSGVTALTVEIRGNGDLDGFLHFLQDLEGGRSLVRVERIHVERIGGQAYGVATDEEVLSFAATVRGFALTTDSTRTPVGGE